MGQSKRQLLRSVKDSFVYCFSKDIGAIVLERILTIELEMMYPTLHGIKEKVFHEQKIKKDKVSESIELVSNPDILLNLGKHKRMDQILVGFAAETENHIAHAKIKLQQKNLDWIAVNNVSGNQGFESDDNEITLISNEEQSIIFEKEDKISLAKKILDLVYP